VTNLGKRGGDDFKKFPLEGGKSRNRFLGDEFGTASSDEDGKWFSPGSSQDYYGDGFDGR